MNKDLHISVLEERLQRLEEIASLGTWEMDISSGQSRWSDQFYKICGYEPGSIKPSSEVGMKLIHPDDRERAKEAVQLAFKNNSYKIEKRIIRPNGEIRHVDSRGKVKYDENGNPVTLLGTFLDITERKEAEIRVQELAIHDGLTGVFNRNYTLSQLDLEIVRSKRYGTSFSLLMLDLDNFKRFNDKHGHQAGDRVLCYFTEIASGVIRENDCLGRYGGEEFLIILHECNLENAKVAAEKIRSTLSKGPYPKNFDFIEQISVSIGVASYDGKEEAADLISRADTALYLAKDAGRNCIRC